MDDISYGAYNLYFKCVSVVGALPLKVDNRANRISVESEGFSIGLYYINLIVSTFYLFFQIFQLTLFSVSHEENSFLLISQLTWTLLAALPLANYYFMLGNEEHFAEIIDEWCQLERRIIGKT